MKPGKGTTYTSKQLDGKKFTRSNSYVYLGNDGKYYVTAKSNGTEYYVPIKNMNNWGNPTWLDEGYSGKFYKGQQI
jgi:hypothetical protein